MKDQNAEISTVNDEAMDELAGGGQPRVFRSPKRFSHEIAESLEAASSSYGRDDDGPDLNPGFLPGLYK